MKFICKGCKYRFESELDQTNRTCPYCGVTGIEEEPDAQGLLED